MLSLEERRFADLSSSRTMQWDSQGRAITSSRRSESIWRAGQEASPQGGPSTASARAWIITSSTTAFKTASGQPVPCVICLSIVPLVKSTIPSGTRRPQRLQRRTKATPKIARSMHKVLNEFSRIIHFINVPKGLPATNAESLLVIIHPASSRLRHRDHMQHIRAAVLRKWEFYVPQTYRASLAPMGARGVLDDLEWDRGYDQDFISLPLFVPIKLQRRRT